MPEVKCLFLTDMDENIAAGVCVDTRAQSRTAEPRMPGRISTDTPAVAFLFPGLGGEIFGRFTEMACLSAAFSDVVSRADAIVAKRFRRSVSELARLNSSADRTRSTHFFRRPVSKDAPPTDVAHCLLYTFECALAHAWIEWGLRPQYVMGYSLGEYSAACLAGLFNFETGLALVIERAALLMNMPAGAMISVSAGCEELRRNLEPDIHVVAENSQTQTILGGDKRALERAAQLFRDRGYAVQVLPVELAFHTPMVKAATSGMERLFSTVQVATPRIPLISTLTGELLNPDQLTDPTHWAQHLCKPVQFRRALQSLTRLGTQIFLEVGPGQALSSMVDLELREYPGLTIVASMPPEFDVRPAQLHITRTALQLRSVGVASVNTPIIGPQDASVVPMVAAEVVGLEAGVLANIQRIWSSALQVGSVGPDDNLFDLGGNSMRTARIAAQIKRDFDIELSLRDIYSAPTPRQLASLVSVGRRLMSDGAQILTLPNGVSVKCHSQDDATRRYKTIFERRVYLRNGLHFGHESVVVDVGADIGLFSIFAALEAQEIKLFSLEPDRALFEILRFNMADVCENAVLVNSGIPTVATMLQEGTLQTIDFMRMDIRGYDIGILDTIADEGWRRIRQVVIEIGSRRNHLDAIRTLLISRNFNVTVEPHHCGDSGAGYSFFAVRQKYDNYRMPE